MPMKVLIADDEGAIRALFFAALTRASEGRYDVLVARDGEEALSIALREKPDLVFLDATMPKLSGFDVCRRLKSAPGTVHIKVIMLSALAGTADLKAAEEAGADDYLIKPVTPIELQEKVKEILGL